MKKLYITLFLLSTSISLNAETPIVPCEPDVVCETEEAPLDQGLPYLLGAGIILSYQELKNSDRGK